MDKTHDEFDQIITPERVRWMAAYRAANPGWGLFHVSLEDANYDCGAAEPPEDAPEAVTFMVDWFNELSEEGREELGRRVRTLEQVREQDQPPPLPRDVPELMGAPLGAAAKVWSDLGKVTTGVVLVPPRHAMTQNHAAYAAAWTGDAAYHEELAAGRLGKQARLAYAWLQDAVANNGGEPVTIVEALAGRVRNVNLARARYTELYYQGAVVKCPVRECKVNKRSALTWKAVPPPWTPVAGSRASASTLRPLLREAAALLRKAAGQLERASDSQAHLELVSEIEVRATEYETAASDVYTQRHSAPGVPRG